MKRESLVKEVSRQHQRVVRVMIMNKSPTRMTMETGKMYLQKRTMITMRRMNLTHLSGKHLISS
jgi:hypothetical protein